MVTPGCRKRVPRSGSISPPRCAASICPIRCARPGTLLARRDEIDAGEHRGSTEGESVLQLDQRRRHRRAYLLRASADHHVADRPKYQATTNNTAAITREAKPCLMWTWVEPAEPRQEAGSDPAGMTK